jgi:hypothetical protein
MVLGPSKSDHFLDDEPIRIHSKPSNHATHWVVNGIVVLSRKQEESNDETLLTISTFFPNPGISKESKITRVHEYRAGSTGCIVAVLSVRAAQSCLTPTLYRLMEQKFLALYLRDTAELEEASAKLLDTPRSVSTTKSGDYSDIH